MATWYKFTLLVAVNITLNLSYVYKIPCCNFSWSYIRETGRSLATNEQCENSGLKAPEFANHALSHNHRILILTTPRSLKLIDNGNYPVRMFLESWQTMLTRIGDNINSCLCPRQYSILFSKKFLNIFFLNFPCILLIKFLFYCIMLELFSVLNHFVRLRPQSNRSKARIS